MTMEQKTQVGWWMKMAGIAAICAVFGFLWGKAEEKGELQQQLKTNTEMIKVHSESIQKMEDVLVRLGTIVEFHEKELAKKRK